MEHKMWFEEKNGSSWIKIEWVVWLRSDFCLEWNSYKPLL